MTKLQLNHSIRLKDVQYSGLNLIISDLGILGSTVIGAKPSVHELGIPAAQSFTKRRGTSLQVVGVPDIRVYIVGDKHSKCDPLTGI